MFFNFFKRKNKQLGNPGIAWYIKKKYYNDTLKLLDKNGQFHVLTRTEGVLRKFIYKDFEYKKEITNCDFSKERFNDNDVIVMIWVVDKSLK